MVLSLNGCYTYIPPAYRQVANSRELTLSYDVAWQRTIDWFARNNTPLKTIDKASGIIISEPDLKCSVGEYLDCGGGYEACIDGLISFNITVQKNQDASLSIRINSFPTAFVSAVHFGGGGVVSRQKCYSNGKIEKTILDYIETGNFEPINEKDK